MTYRKGFSLLELILVGALICVVMAAILSLQSFVLGNQLKHWRARRIADDSTYSIESIKNAMRRASVIAEPVANGRPSARLMAYVNVNQADMTSRVVASAPQSYFMYCFEAAQGKLYKYSGPYPPPAVLMPLPCGLPAMAGQTQEVVISGLENASVSYTFTRQPTNPNSVDISYYFKHHEEELNGYTSVNVERNL